MKIFKYILISIALISFWQCSEEDDITAEIVPYRRSYDVNSPDTVMRFVSQYYYKYNHVFITDPDSSDYLYNFESKNPVRMVQAEQTTEHLLYGISYMKELFLDFYPDEFIKNHFPFSLIIADSIGLTEYPQGPKDHYVTRNFVALNVGEMTKNYTFEQKKFLSLTMHLEFIVNVLYTYGNGLELTEFFSPGEKLYSTATGDWDNEKKWKLEELFAAGFLYDDKGDYYPYTGFVSKSQDLKDWLSFLWGYKEDKWSKIPDNVEELIDTYPVMKQKYDVLTKAIKDCIGVDYKDLIYKEK